MIQSFVQIFLKLQNSIVFQMPWINTSCSNFAALLAYSSLFYVLIRQTRFRSCREHFSKWEFEQASPGTCQICRFSGLPQPCSLSNSDMRSNNLFPHKSSRHTLVLVHTHSLEPLLQMYENSFSNKSHRIPEVCYPSTHFIECSSKYQLISLKSSYLYNKI